MKQDSELARRARATGVRYRQRPVSVLKTILRLPATGCLPRELLTTDRIMQRWAVGCGNGLPSDAWDDTRVSRPPALDDQTQCIVDDIVKALPPKTHAIIVGWYLRPLPTRELARELEISPRTLERGWHVSLNFLKWKFERCKHLTLARLLALRVDDHYLKS